MEKDKNSIEPLHDPEETMCLNYFFGAYSSKYKNEGFRRNITEFYTWLQKIMVNSIRVFAGFDKLNPVPLFFLTFLAPGWAGGILTGLTLKWGGGVHVTPTWSCQARLVPNYVYDIN